MLQQFDDLVSTAAKTSTSPVRPWITLNSTGGDVATALMLGRKLRQSEAIADTGFGDVCYSACVFLLAGAVDRGIGIGGKIGLHRPYFVDSASSSLSVADIRYKKMMTEVQSYLREMNMPERLFQIMESTPPDEVNILSNQEKKDLWFGSKDPAYAEAEIAWEASIYGLSSLEFRQRSARLDAQCGSIEHTPQSLQNNVASLCRQVSNSAKMVTACETKYWADYVKNENACRARWTSAVMWGVTEKKSKEIDDQVTARCRKEGYDSAAWYACKAFVGADMKQLPEGFIPLD